MCKTKTIKLILIRKDGSTRMIRWGSIPHEWHEPVYFDNVYEFGKKPNPDAVSSTIGKRTFHLSGVGNLGFLWFKYKVAYYEEI